MEADGVEAGAHDVDRQEVHRVHEQRQHERRERDRRDEARGAVVDALDLLVDEVDGELDKRLRLRRHALRRLAGHEPHEAESQNAEHRRGQQRVDVQRPEPAFPDRMREERQVMLDVFGRSCVRSGHRRCRRKASVANEQGNAEQQYGDDEGRQQCRNDDLPVVREHQPKLADDHEDFCGFGPE